MRKRLPTVLQVYESAPASPDGRRRVMGKLVLFSRHLEQYFEDFTTRSKRFMTNDVISGSGSIGTVFRACLQGDKLLAVRKLPTLGVLWNEEAFEQEVGKLSNVRHRSLVFLHGYYTSPSMQLVLSEYMPNGTLHQHLHLCAHELPLNWPTRLNIAHDIARALAYLHDECRPPILHLNVKSSNIFLNSSFDPFLADYGLCNFHPSMTAYVTNQATAGYIAPKVACQGLELTDKSDVYNFGVVLVELATSKPPVLQHDGDDVLLLQMVRAASEEGRMKLTTYLDASLMRANPKFIAAEMMAMIKLGLSCTTELPARRPTMAQVVRWLEEFGGLKTSRQVLPAHGLRLMIMHDRAQELLFHLF